MKREGGGSGRGGGGRKGEAEEKEPLSGVDSPPSLSGNLGTLTPCVSY